MEPHGPHGAVALRPYRSGLLELIIHNHIQPLLNAVKDQVSLGQTGPAGVLLQFAPCPAARIQMMLALAIVTLVEPYFSDPNATGGFGVVGDPRHKKVA